MTKQFELQVGMTVWMHPMGDYAHLLKDELVKGIVTKVLENHFYCWCEAIGETKINKEGFFGWNDNLLIGFVVYQSPEDYVLHTEKAGMLASIRNLSFSDFKESSEVRRKLLDFLYAEGILTEAYEGFKKQLDERYELRTVYADKTSNGSYGGVYRSRLEAVKQNPGKEIVFGFCVIDTITNFIPEGCNVWNNTVDEAVTDFEKFIERKGLTNPETKEIPKQLEPQPLEKEISKKSETKAKPSRKPKTDMTGMVFGRLRVIGNGEKKGYVLCECECGTKKEILESSLTRTMNPTRSCGCLRKENGLRQSVLKRGAMVGKTFGSLRVVAISDKLGYVVCECECGTRKEFLAADLTKKKNPVRSCGCVENKNNNAEGSIRFPVERALNKNNTSGRTGVSYDDITHKYHAYIGVRRKFFHLGSFDSFGEAVKAREDAEKKYHKPLIEAKKMAKMEKEKMGA